MGQSGCEAHSHMCDNYLKKSQDLRTTMGKEQNCFGCQKGPAERQKRERRLREKGDRAVSGGRLMMDAGHGEWVSWAVRPTPARVITT